MQESFGQCIRLPELSPESANLIRHLLEALRFVPLIITDEFWTVVLTEQAVASIGARSKTSEKERTKVLLQRL